MAIAVDDMVNTPPTAKAACQDRPNHMPMAIVLSVDTRTCAVPMPNTIRRIAINRGIDTSSPMVNSRKTTPISAICSIA
jgi:hypothetical protein